MDSDDDFWEGADDFEDSSYMCSINPLFKALEAKFKEIHPTAVLFVLGPRDFAEIGLFCYEQLNALMYPSKGSGSIERYVARITTGTGKLYYLVKISAYNIEQAEKEIKVGKVIAQLGREITDIMIPAIFGVVAEEEFSVVVPWVIDTLALDTFCFNNQVKILALSTRDILRAIYPIVAAVYRAWQVARFIQWDWVKGQILVSSSPFSLYVVDFGRTSVDYTSPEGNRILVSPDDEEVTDETFRASVRRLLKHLHLLILEESPNKERELVYQWNKHTLFHDEEKFSIQELLKWLVSV